MSKRDFIRNNRKYAEKISKGRTRCSECQESDFGSEEITDAETQMTCHKYTCNKCGHVWFAGSVSIMKVCTTGKGKDKDEQT